MRFIQNGPSIPDELLTARDAGEVLFFCGAGVSRAKALLPDFLSLAKRVLDILGSGLESPARRLLDQAKTQPGTVTTDRIFGLLEREFDQSDVREAVAMALQPTLDVSLDAHQLLLDLSRDRTGVPRLVTTNFDALFENCELGIESFNPPKLPDPRRHQDFRGIVHLHGCVDNTYRGARDDVFVLSSADFGHAYLADGWASRYIQALLQRFQIVFVGYSADDPPVQYLLEALNRFAMPSQSLYAFQSGNASEDLAQWTRKGVTPIPYDKAGEHAALWETLAAWATRARNVEAWHQQLIKAASERGPAKMAPHERGMVAHIFTTEMGARFLAGSETLLPASWLSVVDPQLRYARPHQRELGCSDTGHHFDPFDAYGLDFDEIPSPVDQINHYAPRNVPEGAWNGLDCQANELPSVYRSPNGRRLGLATKDACDLPTRLIQIGSWLTRVAHQPAALWWAARYLTLHSSVLDGIERRLLTNQEFTPTLRAGWRMAISCMRFRTGDADYRYHTIATQAKLEGWSTQLVREAMDVYRPQLTMAGSFNAIPPEPGVEVELNALARFDVDYPRPYIPIEIPANLLAYGIGHFRQILNHGLDLEREVSGGDIPYFDTIRADDGKALPTDAHGLTGHLVFFTNLVSQLAEHDITAAKREVAQWSLLEHQVFIRLKIWAAGRANLTTPEQSSQTFLDLDDATFWSSHQERDLLFSLRDRWQEYQDSLKNQIEARLLISHIPWLDGQPDLVAGEAHERLNRLHWLFTHGVKFTFDYDSVIASLRAVAPRWDERSAQQTAQPNVSEVFSVTTDVDSTAIDRLPLVEVLIKAKELASDDSFARVRKDPFLGLAKSRPSRALSVLTLAKKTGSFPASAWMSFLSAQAEKSSPRRLLFATAMRLARLRADELIEISQPTSNWMHNVHLRLQQESFAAFAALWKAMMAAMHLPKTAPPRSAPIPRRWVDEGLNSPAGRLGMAQQRQLADIGKAGKGLPASWKLRTEELLGLPQDHRNHVIAMIAADIGWLYYIDQAWTMKHLISILAGDNEAGIQAFWSGFLWRASGLHPDLFPHLKAGLMRLAKSPELSGREQTRSIAGLLLVTWSNCKRRDEKPPQLSDAELREVLIHADDSFRMAMLWCVQHWCKKKDENWSEFLIPFLTKVWPRQLAARTPSGSGRLVGLALALPDRFLEVAEAIQRNLVVSNNHFMTIFDESHTKIAEKHPLELLALLSASLGEDPSSWPFEIGKLLAVLAEQPLTRDDPRLIRLRERDERRM